MSLVKNLKVNFKDFSLDIPHLEILDQGVTVLSGPSGSGKSTLFNALIGLENAVGMIWDFNGRDLARLKPPERNIGVVFQSLDLFPHLTARENIEFAAKSRRIESKIYNEKIQSYAKVLSLESILDKKASLLSGGEKQRVAFLRAVVGGPTILLLDEPFSSLDIDLRNESRQLLKAIIKKENIPVFLITHDPEDVQALADRVYNLKGGKLV
jgi:sulfate transport system ATP-binding protein/putative spermidine/putrescine transport system ATP-binding protein